MLTFEAMLGAGVASELAKSAANRWLGAANLPPPPCYKQLSSMRMHAVACSPAHTFAAACRMSQAWDGQEARTGTQGSCTAADNMWALESWCKKRFQGMEETLSNFFRENGLTEDIDYIV